MAPIYTIKNKKAKNSTPKHINNKKLKIKIEINFINETKTFD